MVKIKGWTINLTPPRKKEVYDKKIGIIKNGDDNAYPTRMEYALNNSITAKACANTYKRFLIGEGFKDTTLNTIVVGRDEEKNVDITAFDLLVTIAHEFSRHSGTWIKVGYNGNVKVDSLFATPSKYCRFGKEDDRNYKGKILVYDNWDKVLNPKDERFKVKDIEQYHTYDSKENNIKYQVTGKSNASDIEYTAALPKWKGQIFTKFLDTEFTYPLSHIDPVQHDSDTEFQISLFKNGELRRGFFAKYMLIHEEFEDNKDYDKFIADLQTFEGASEGGSVMMVEVDRLTNDDQMKPASPFVLEKIEQNINDKLFKEYETTISNNIRKAYNNIPPVLIDYQEGKLGNTSGESIIQAANYYNTQTSFDRMTITGIFKELMKNWHEEKYNDKDWEIKKLDYGPTNNI